MKNNFTLATGLFLMAVALPAFASEKYTCQEIDKTISPFYLYLNSDLLAVKMTSEDSEVVNVGQYSSHIIKGNPGSRLNGFSVFNIHTSGGFGLVELSLIGGGDNDLNGNGTIVDKKGAAKTILVTCQSVAQD